MATTPQTTSQKPDDAPRPADLDQSPARVAPGAAGIDMGPPWVHPACNRRHIDGLWMTVCAFLFLAGLCFFGWRGLVVVLITGLSATVVHAVVYKILCLVRRHPADSIFHAAMLGVLAGLCLPVIADLRGAIMVGSVVGITSHVLGRTHTLRVHPVAFSIVLIAILIPASGTQHDGEPAPDRFNPTWAVLTPSHVFTGDLTDAAEGINITPWSMPPDSTTADALLRDDPYRTMIRSQTTAIEHPNTFKDMLARGDVPPLGEIILGCTPSLIGGCSRAMIIVLGLVLIYRRVSWGAVVGTAFISAIIALLVMPLEYQQGHTIVFNRLSNLGWEVGVTYVAYMILSSPLALVALILAPQTAPMSRQGRVAYGMIIGAGMIIIQWYTHTPLSAFLALTLASLLSRPLDALHLSPFAQLHPDMPILPTED